MPDATRRMRHRLDQLRLGLRHQSHALHSTRCHVVEGIETRLLDVSRSGHADGGQFGTADDPPDSATLTRQGRRHCTTTCVGLELGHTRSSDLAPPEPRSRSPENSEGDVIDGKAAGQRQESISVIAPNRPRHDPRLDRIE